MEKEKLLCVIVKYTELDDKNYKGSSYNQLIISITFSPNAICLTI